MTKRDVYQEVTDQIIEALEQGVAPWASTWTAAGEHHNALSGKPYRGVNQLLLWIATSKKRFAGTQWLTYRQAKERGGSVRKGEKGTRIIFWKPVQKRDEEEKSSYLIARTYTVFNLDQCDGVKLPERRESVETDTDLDEFVRGTGAKIISGADRCAYMPTADVITIPAPEQFTGTHHYYAALFHELTHWTGAKKRLDRDFTGRFGTEAYAVEELVAELGAAFLCARLGVEGDCQHPGYIDHWLEVLRGDKRAVFTAAGKARKAADFLLGVDVRAEEEAA